MLHLPSDILQWDIAPYLTPSDKVAFNRVGRTGRIYARIPKKKLDEMEWLMQYTILKRSLRRVTDSASKGVSKRVRRKNWSRFYNMFDRYAIVFRYHMAARRMYLEKLETVQTHALGHPTDIRTRGFMQKMLDVYTTIKYKLDTEYVFKGGYMTEEPNGKLPSFQ